MKKLLLNPLAIILSLIAAAFFVFTLFSWKAESGSSSSGYTSSIINNQVNDTSYGGVFYKPAINDSLPYVQYKRIEDSLLYQNQLRLRNNETFGNSFSNRLIGFTELIDNKTEVWDTKNNKQYFLSLAGFELEEEVKFFIEKNTYNLVYLQWDTVGRKGENIERIGSYKRVAIPVRYSNADKKIFIPISANQFTAGYVVLLVLSVLMIAFILFVIFGYPIQFLIRVSKGQAFTEANVSGLRVTALLIFISFIVSVTFPFLIRLVFSSFIHPLFKPLKFWPQLYDHLPSLFLAVLVFAIYLAFKKGYKLQQEQELTV